MNHAVAIRGVIAILVRYKPASTLRNTTLFTNEEAIMNGYTHHEMIPLGSDETPYRLLTTDHVSTGSFEGVDVLKG